MAIVTVNAGSSSVRLDAFPAGGGQRRRVHQEGNARAAVFIDFLGDEPVQAVAHRVVHGGDAFPSTARIDAGVESRLEALVPLAPLHNAPALEWIRAARAATGPEVPHFAVFDTAFFSGLPEASRTYALPRAWRERHGVRRFGFHGLAHASMWRAWARARPEGAASARVVTFQLGSGCSAAAIVDGKPVETSMGFTPLEGLVMATRAGSIDPGILLFLLREGVPLAEVDAALSRESGLRAIAGEGDMRRLLARDDPEARLAVDLFVRAARHQLGAYLAALGGAEAVIFGGGVGENQPAIRERILEGMEWAGLVLDRAANRDRGTDGVLTASNSRIECRVVAVDEAAILAEEAAAAIQTPLPRSPA